MSPFQTIPAHSTTGLPTLTRDQVREVDRIAIEELAVPGIVLMENAAINATEALLSHLRSHWGRGTTGLGVAVLCGGGNNGGDGYAIGRQLHNRGAAVTCYAFKEPAELTGDAATNHSICRHMRLPIESVPDPSALRAATDRWGRVDVIVDALLGTGFHGEVRQPMAGAIDVVNGLREGEYRRRPMVLAVDVPSGLDCAEGAPTNATMRADLTVTFVAAKTGLLTDAARPHVGELAVADIGVPPALVERVRHLG